MKLKNKVAVVTGGARDIGRAVCIKLASEGAKVVVMTLKFSLANPAATPIIFCSAIPKSRYFSGKVFLNLSRPAEVDTSQVKTIRLSISFASSKAAIPNVALAPMVDQILIFRSLIFTKVFL